MTFTLISNFFNHHQKPLCDSLRKILGSDFTFIETIPIPPSFIKGGYQEYTGIDYLLKAFENEENFSRAQSLIDTSDIVVFGCAPHLLLTNRIKSNKVTFVYSERIFKKNRFQKFHPIKIYFLCKWYTKYRHRQLFLLSTSGFATNDFKWVYSFPNKIYKWGYFTKTEKLSINQILENKRFTKFTILFIGRLIEWKHPEMLIKLAANLKEENIDFSIKIIGSGTMKPALQSLVIEYGVGNLVEFLGNMKNEDVLSLMRSSHVCLCPSDRNEGWGTVVNEAMANGCTVVGSNLMGSVPYLIEPNNNGLIFRSLNMSDATQKVLNLANNYRFREMLALNAYRTITTMWSSKNAAMEILKLGEQLIENKKPNVPEDGPCSFAFATKNNWHQIN